MAETAGLAIGAVALIPLIENVRQIYDAIKDAPETYYRYQTAIHRLSDTLEVMQLTFEKYENSPGQQFLKKPFEGTLADINTLFTKLRQLLQRGVKGNEGRKGFVKRVLWVLLYDKGARGLMDQVEIQTLLLNVQFQTMIASNNAHLYGSNNQAGAGPVVNALVTQGADIRSLISALTTLGPKVEEIHTLMFANVEGVNGSITDVEPDDAEIVSRPTYIGQSAGAEHDTRIIFWGPPKNQPIKETTTYTIARRHWAENGWSVKVYGSKSRWKGRQSRITIKSHHQIDLQIYCKSLGVSLHLTLGLGIGRQSFCPKFGLYCRRIIPQGHPYWQIAYTHDVDQLRVLLEQGLLNVYDMYKFDSSIEGREYSILEIAMKDKACNSKDALFSFVELLVHEGYRPDFRDMAFLIFNKQLRSVRFLMSEGLFEWNNRFLIVASRRETNNETSDYLKVRDWGFLWKQEYLDEIKFLPLGKFSKSRELRWELAFLYDPPKDLVQQLIRQKGIWVDLPYGVFSLILRYSNEFLQMGDQEMIAFLGENLPDYENIWTEHDRYIMLVTAVWYRRSAVIEFLLSRYYPYSTSTTYDNDPTFDQPFLFHDCRDLAGILQPHYSPAIIARVMGIEEDWKRSLKIAVPGLDPDHLYQNECQKLSLKDRLLLAECSTCGYRRVGYFNTQDRHDRWKNLRTGAQVPKNVLSENWDPCYDCDFGTLECPKCGEIPGGLHKATNSCLAQSFDLPDDPKASLASRTWILLARLSRYIGITGWLLVALVMTVFYLLYRLNEAESLRQSLLIYNGAKEL